MSICGRFSISPIQLVVAMFGLSGLTGLSYEIIWFKLFSHVWGSSALAMGIVVAVFLFGLGLGAYCLGAYCDRFTQPVVWYGLCEIGIGIAVLLIPWEVSALGAVSAYIPALRQSPIWSVLLRCVATFAILGPPCVLMGATLPLIVRAVSSTHGVVHAAGLLYGMNTLGAAAGCWLVGFYLLPELGLFWTNVVTAGISLFIGAVAIRITARQSADVERKAGQLAINEQQELVEEAYPASTIYLVSAITGFAALSLQVVWNRQMSVVLGSSTYAFSATLFIVLAGIGLGSLLFHSLLVKFSGGATLVHMLLSVAVLSTAAGIWLLPFSADCVGVSVPLRGDYLINSVVCISAGALVEFLPAVAMGALFPCLVSLAGARAAWPSGIIGTLYACNTAGTLVGTMATSIWIVPTWGTHVAVGIALISWIGASVLLIARGRATPLLSFCALAVASVTCGWYWRTPEDPARTNRGMFLYGYSSPDADLSKTVYFKEGIASNVLVEQRKDGSTSVRVNGKVDGSNRGDMSMQLGLAYLPRFLNPSASKVLVIGFGTGTTSGASLLFPGTHVTCCEIEPGMVAAAPFFSEVNHDPLKSAELTIVYDDARAYVQQATEKFDLILSEPSNPWVAGVSNLFTAEFYECASRRLSPDGVFAQWIQTYSFDVDDYKMILRTMRKAFPYQRLIRISNGDTIVLGAGQSLDRDQARVLESQRLVDASPGCEADLKKYFGTSDVAALLLTRVLLDERGISQLIDRDGAGRLNLDWDLQLEFNAARHLYDRREVNVGRALIEAIIPEWISGQYSRLGCSASHASSLHDLAMLLVGADRRDAALELVDLGLRERPDSPDLLADKLILTQTLDIPALERLLASNDPTAALAANRIGVAFWETKKYTEAANVFDRLTVKFPNAPNLWTNLAINYALSGNTEQAELAHRRALELDPTNTFSRQARESANSGKEFDGPQANAPGTGAQN